MHTLIVGSEDKERHLFLERLIKHSGISEPSCGFLTTMSEADAEGNAEIHIHPLSGGRTFSDENLVGICRDRRATVFPEAFDRFSYLLGKAPENGLILMDGIGPMEEKAPLFRESVLKALDGDTPVLASVRDKDTEFLLKVRNHPKARCFVMGEDDEKLFHEALDFFISQLESASLI